MGDLVRWAATLVFVIFAGKFVNHASELASFRNYGLPAPGILVIAVGVLELAGGQLLASGRLLTLTALAPCAANAASGSSRSSSNDPWPPMSG